jgi:hypothetical protein
MSREVRKSDSFGNEGVDHRAHALKQEAYIH